MTGSNAMTDATTADPFDLLDDLPDDVEPDDALALLPPRATWTAGQYAFVVQWLNARARRQFDIADNLGDERRAVHGNARRSSG